MKNLTVREKAMKYINARASLETTIGRALAMLDPKGTNTQISQAMSIVRIGFSQAETGAEILPCDLFKKACAIYPSAHVSK